MKIQDNGDSYTLIANNDKENEVIAVLVNRLDLSDYPQLYLKEGCFVGKKDRNYVTIPYWVESDYPMKRNKK